MTSGVAYVTRMLKTTSLTDLKKILAEAPLSEEEINFILDAHQKMSLKQMAQKYGLTVSGVAKRKNRIYTRFQYYDINRLKR